MDDNKTDHQTHSVPFSKYSTPIQAIGMANKMTLNKVRNKKGFGLFIPCIALHVIILIATKGKEKDTILKKLTPSDITFGSFVNIDNKNGEKIKKIIPNINEI